MVRIETAQGGALRHLHSICMVKVRQLHERYEPVNKGAPSI